MENKVKKFVNIDIVRVILAIFVIAAHSFNSGLLHIRYFKNGVVRLAVPLFFMLSGYALTQEKVKDFNFIKKYISRQANIFLPWLVLYFFFGLYIVGIQKDAMQFGLLIAQFWFVISTWSGLIFLHLFLKLFTLKQAVLISFVLYLIGMFGDVYYLLVEDVYLIGDLYDLYLSLFFTTRNGLFFGLFFISCGLYLSEYKPWEKLKSSFLISMIVLFSITQFVELTFLFPTHAQWYNMYFSVLPLSVFVFCFIKKHEVVVKSKLNYKRISVYIFITHTLLIYLISNIFGLLNQDIVFVYVVLVYVVLIAIKYLVIDKHYKSKYDLCIQACKRIISRSYLFVLMLSLILLGWSMFYCESLFVFFYITLCIVLSIGIVKCMKIKSENVNYIIMIVIAWGLYYFSTLFNIL